MIDPDFIKRCEEFAKPMVIDFLERRRERINKWNKDNPEKLRECRQKYEKTEKGKKARKRVYLKRSFWISQCLKYLTKEEKKRIREIYIQRKKYPGFEVDHIIPICEGGVHHPNNLRIIPRKENMIKGRKLDYKMTIK